MKSSAPIFSLALFLLLTGTITSTLSAQTDEYDIVTISTGESYQTLTGFGGALAFYESWVTGHPYKTEIYKALYNELSLDILRLRNAYDYDAGMIDRAKEFAEYAELYRGKPIDILVTSWGPPAYLKSNNNRKDGGTLKYTKTGSAVNFDYAGFAHWWNKSLDEYNANGIFPTYISIQNEPDFRADWESCILRPTELIGPNDTLAGYDKALDAVYDTVQTRTVVPKFLGPECVGIGYNSVENYINALDLSKLYSIAHHLYGTEESTPFNSSEFAKVGAFHPEVPHFQTEFSGGNWWTVIGLMYKALHDENAAAYFYWDLAWTGAGLIDMDNPWNRSSWSNTKGYKKTKEFYAFKQYSAFIHPGWQRIESSIDRDDMKVLTFLNPAKDSATTLLINTSEDINLYAALVIPGYKIEEAEAYVTSATKNCQLISNNSSVVEVGPLSAMTIAMKISETTDVLIESMEITPAGAMIDSRLDSITLSAAVLPESATNKTVFWQIVSGNEIASLSKEGVLKSLGTGNGTVTVKALAIDGSDVSATLDVEISNQVLVQSINLTASAAKITTPGGSIQFNATALPEEAFNKELFWEILSGNEIASLSQDGLLQALGVQDGNVSFQVSSTDGSEITKSLTIAVSNQLSSVEGQTRNTVRAWSQHQRIFYQLPILENEAELSLISMSGRTIYSQHIAAGQKEGTFSIQHQPGIYILKIQSNGYFSTTFLSVQN